ncbi:hypothetical protein MFIFM68171_03642 [Madurella fahalii]|uniref:Rhodopsin domain-containing protein n=1 Tax=Madurella fahalii TaxID=1157608 RepID=A0ABQ0G6Q5_9PEZI
MSGPAWPAIPPKIAAENNGPRMLTIGWTFTATATLFVAGRIFSRFKKLGKIDKGDYLVLTSLALGYIYMIIITVAVHAGSGRHVAVLTIPQAERALLFTTIGFIPGILSYTIPKFAVVILIKDLLSPSRRHVTAIWALAGVNAVLIVLCITFVYVQCDPPRALWTVGIKARCWDPVALIATSIAGGASSALFDFWLALYPAAVLWGMQINLRKKVALSTALGFGICAGSVAVYKCTTFKEAGEDFGDFTYTAVDLVIWTSIEANSVIISACIPMLMPLVELIFGENFLSGDRKPQLRTIQTYPQVENTPGDDGMGIKAGAKDMEDWKKQFQGVSTFPEESADGSKSGSESNA